MLTITPPPIVTTYQRQRYEDVISTPRTFKQKPARTFKTREPFYLPTPEEITTLCRKIQDSWSPGEKHSRGGGTP